MKYYIFILVSLFVLAMIFYYISIKAIKKNYEKKISELKKQINEANINTISTNILRKILEISFNRESFRKSSANIIKILIQNYNLDYCTIFQRDKNTGKLSCAASNIDDMDIIENITEYSNKKLGDMSDASAQLSVCRNGYLNYPTANDRHICYSYFVPLQAGHGIVGAVLIENKTCKSSTDLEIEIFKVIIDTITVTFQNLIYYNKIVAMATRDGLTGVFNRRYQDSFLLDRMNKEHSKFYIAIMDIDHFKNFNDTYGHTFGDEVLINLSSYIKNRLKSHGEIFRYGGEEFLVYLNGSIDADKAYGFINNIREGISKINLTYKGTSINITASFGFVEYIPGKFKDVDTLVKAADKALYYSKEHGRNRVTNYEKVLA